MVFKANKVKKTNKIILISFTWELGTLGDAPKRMANMCASMFCACMCVCVCVCFNIDWQRYITYLLNIKEYFVF